MDPVNTLFTGGGEMGALMRSHDWSQTLLGSVSSWSHSLKTAVSICLNSRFPMVIWWGKEFILLYNDAWRPILGPLKHPHALGKPGYEWWRENWHIIGQQLNSVVETGEATWSDDLLLPTSRYGYLEEAYYTYSYSPIFLETGEVGGVFTAVAETTQRVLGERRTATLRNLATQTADAKSVEQAYSMAIQTLAENPVDIPFALLYEITETQATLVGQTPTTISPLPTPAVVDITQPNNPWFLASRMHKAVVVENLSSQFGEVIGGSLSLPIDQAFVVPMASGHETIGIMVIGVNPARVLDEDYQSFLKMTAGYVATAIANTRAYEAERQRAEALAELDQAKTVFFSNVSHEFRTPLTLMLSPLEEMLSFTDETPLATLRSPLQMVHRNGLRLLKLVNTLLDFSRIEAGRIQAVYEPTDLATFTTELASVFRSAIEAAELKFTVECPFLDSLVYVDREMWEKIVLNLISNAFKFTFTGEIIVRLQQQSNCVELSIQDTGTGISAEELPHLFKRFYRVKGAKGRSFEGSGIGLSLVQELVHLHKGTVTVNSTLGKGSCFKVSIPTGCSHLPKDRIHISRTLVSTALGTAAYVEEALRWLPNVESQELEDLESISSDSITPARILLADDNADMRDYVNNLLNQRYVIETVPDGVAALAAIRKQPPDLLLTDVMMPEMDGFELLRELRANPSTREIPTILLSARAGEESRVEGLEAGADDYLIKPFSARELVARVESTLKMAQLRREATKQEMKLRIEAETIKDQLEAVLSSISEGFVVFDHDWRYTYINNRLLQMLGTTKEEILGKTIWQVFPDTVETEIYTKFHQAVAEQKPIHFEYFYTKWNRWFENHVYPSSNGASVFTQEITERKQALQALQESEERYRTLANAVPQMMWINTPDGEPQFFNHHNYEYVGAKPQKHQDFNQLEYVHPEDISTLIAAKTKSIQTGEGYEIEVRLKRYDNTYRWHLSRIIPLKNHKGQILCWYGTSTDIHDTKEISLENARLYQQAQEANQLKDDFLAVLSHELRTPLNPILGWAKLLRSGTCDVSTTNNALEAIERNAKLQTQLIDDLLDISRILRGKLTLAIAPVSLASVITSALETVQLAAQAKEIHIQTALEPNIPRIAGDSSRLQQIIWNLLSNAVKFTPHHGRIEIRLSQVAQKAQIQVIDNGKGISADFLPHVFEYFRQADSSTTRTFGGLGLGLAIVHQLVEMHGGTVAVESQGEGKGTTFTVKLPLMEESKSTIHEIASTSSLVTQPLQGIEVLVVDDDRDNLDFLTFILLESGANAIALESAQEALSILQQRKFDILLSDIGMPEMDGYALIKLIRQLTPEQGGQIPAIALTAYAGQTNQQQALEVGFSHHIAKPVDIDELLEVISIMLS
jgi:PAS domain S-box-containing protein